MGLPEETRKEIMEALHEAYPDMGSIRFDFLGKAVLAGINPTSLTADHEANMEYVEKLKEDFNEIISKKTDRDVHVHFHSLGQ